MCRSGLVLCDEFSLFVQSRMSHPPIAGYSTGFTNVWDIYIDLVILPHLICLSLKLHESWFFDLVTAIHSFRPRIPKTIQASQAHTLQDHLGISPSGTERESPSSEAYRKVSPYGTLLSTHLHIGAYPYFMVMALIPFTTPNPTLHNVIHFGVNSHKFNVSLDS